MMPEISIAIIVKNEENSIEKVISGIIGSMRQCEVDSYELFLVDGYSEDNTVNIAKKFAVNIFLAKGGKGDAVKKAIDVAKGDFILFIDADGSHRAEDIPRLIKSIKENRCDIVIASRILGGSEELGKRNFDNLLRLCGNRLSAFIINLRWRTYLTDVQNGFRIIKRDTAKALGLQEKTFAIEQEMIMKCLKKGGKILEIPGFDKKTCIILSIVYNCLK